MLLSALVLLENNRSTSSRAGISDYTDKFKPGPGGGGRLRGGLAKALGIPRSTTFAFENRGKKSFKAFLVKRARRAYIDKDSERFWCL